MTEVGTTASADGPGEERVVVDPGARSELEHALQFVILMGRAGSMLHDALSAGGATELVGNTEVIVVCSLLLRGPLRPSDVSAMSGLSSGGTTKLIDRLERGGLIVRKLGAVPEDRRVTQLMLTPRGVQVALGFSKAVRDESDAIRNAFAELLAAAEALASTEA